MTLLEQDMYDAYLGPLGNFGVVDVVSQLDVPDASQITKVKEIETSLPA